MRQAADSLRRELAGDTVTFVVNRNINVSNVCTVGCAFCGFGQGRRSPDAYEHSEEEFRRRVREAVAFGATEICMQSGIHPDWTIDDYEHWLRVAKDEAPQLHLHAYSPMELHFMAGELPLRGGVRAPHSPRGSARRRARPPRCSTTACASASRRTSCRWRAGWRSSRPPTRPGCARTVTVMFGHIEEPWELAEHMRVVRELQERTGGFTEFVPLSFIPFHTMLGRTHGIEEISREDNLRHTAAFRLALGRSITNLQASWVKMGLDAATEALDWGINDLGGTLMEESISRLAGLLPRREARAGGPDRGRPRGGPPGRRARHALRDPAGATRCPSPREARLQGLGGAVRPGRAARVHAPRRARSASRSSACPTTSSPGATTAATRPRRSPGWARRRWPPSGAVLGTSVLTPTLRYHPSVVAQSFATLGCLAPGRVFLGVGTGEAMNETPATGQEFPGRKERRLRLAEAIRLIRAALDRGARGLRGRVLPDLEGHDLRPARRAGADLRGRLGPARGEAGGPGRATASSARAARTRRSTTSCSARSRRAPRRPAATRRRSGG